MNVAVDELMHVTWRKKRLQRCARWAVVGWMCSLAACHGEAKPSGASGAVSAAAPAQHSTDASSAALGPKVVFLGDSLSAGAHLPAEQAFPAVLQQKLAAQGVPFQLANAGVSGDTTAGGLRRVNWILRGQPSFVVVELGANDGLRGVPASDIEQNLRAILTKIKAQGARAMLLGVRLPPSLGADYTRAFEAIYPRLAQELNVAYVPFFMQGVAGVPELTLPDGLHPTAEGHARIAETLLLPLKRWLDGHEPLPEGGP